MHETYVTFMMTVYLLDVICYLLQCCVHVASHKEHCLSICSFGLSSWSASMWSIRLLLGAEIFCVKWTLINMHFLDVLLTQTEFQIPILHSIHFITLSSMLCQVVDVTYVPAERLCTEQTSEDILFTWMCLTYVLHDIFPLT